MSNIEGNHDHPIRQSAPRTSSISNTEDSANDHIEIRNGDNEDLAAATARTSLDDVDEAARALQQISNGFTPKKSDIIGKFARSLVMRFWI